MKKKTTNKKAVIKASDDEWAEGACPKTERVTTVALEDIYISVILTFCENAAELGCPRDKEVDMWFRELPYDGQYKVAQKMFDIEDRNLKLRKKG